MQNQSPDPAAVIQRVLGAYTVPNRSYPVPPLPADLAQWSCYTVDGGHSLLVAVSGVLPDDAHGSAIEDALAPVPVRAVLRLGVTWRDGYPVCDVPYDATLGVVTDEADDEF